MKKIWIYLFLLIASTIIPLTSCDNEDIPQPEEVLQHDPESDADQSPIEAYDALEWLQGCIVLVDNKDEIIRRINGKPLDESQPTVISFPVGDLAAAEKTFLKWVAPGKEVTEVDGGYDYYLTDANGIAQGCVSFRAVEDEAGVIARMTVANGTALKQVSPYSIPFTLFARNRIDGVYNFAKCKQKEFVVKEGGVEIMHLYPCYRKSDGVIGMIDDVSGTFFQNDGSGAFTKGAVV